MADVTSPLIVEPRRRTIRMPFRELVAQLLRTGLRSNEENPPANSEDGCYASLLIFIGVCSLGSVMIFSCMMTSHTLTYGVVSIFMILMIIFDMVVMLYFIKSKTKWMDVSHGFVLWASDAPTRDNKTNQHTINEQCDALGTRLSPPTSTKRHQTSRLSLIGIYIFGSSSLIMFSIDIIQVATCIPFSLNEYDTLRFASEDILYVVFRAVANLFFCVQIAFFVCFKHTTFASTPRFCYSLLLFATVNFICLLEGLVYVGSVRLSVTLPWQSRLLPVNLSGDYNILCYNYSRVFDKSVLFMHDILYPFAIEFYILSIGIFLHHWFNLMPIPSKIMANGRDYASQEVDSDSAVDRQRKVQRHCSYVALPLAVFLSLLLIGSAAFLLSQMDIVIYIYHIIRMVYQTLLIIPVLLGVRYLSYFRYDRKQSLDGSEMLLFSTVTGAFLVTAFTGLTASTLLHQFATLPEGFDTKVTPYFNVTVMDSALCLSYSVVNYIQTTIQMCFFVSARRRVPPKYETVTAYRLRECFLYLAVCNAFILATDTFFALQTFRVESPTNVWFFGADNWSILESILYPVAELYHFHSVLLCSELYLSFKVD